MNGNQWALRTYRPMLPQEMPGVLVPDISGWFEDWFPKPAPPQPMEKGKPQEPASGYLPGEGTIAAIGRTVRENIEEGIRNTLGTIFSRDRMLDAGVYLWAAVIALVAIWAMLR